MQVFLFSQSGFPVNCLRLFLAAAFSFLTSHSWLNSITLSSPRFSRLFSSPSFSYTYFFFKHFCMLYEAFFHCTQKFPSLSSNIFFTTRPSASAFQPFQSPLSSHSLTKIFLMRLPGFEPGSKAWQASILTTRLQSH